jgi:hypothetical protein
MCISMHTSIRRIDVNNRSQATNTASWTGDKATAAKSASLEGFGSYRRADNADV